MTTTNDIDAIRKLTDAATPGPWQHDGNDGLVWPQRIGDPVSGSNEMTDADFIAAARTHVPALCDEVAQLRAALTQSRAQAATYANEIGLLTAENARLRQQRDEATAEPVCPACDKPGRHPETCPTVPAELPAEATR